MRNPNALIAMAQVSQNANNPYHIFCEQIKYCIYTNSSDVMTIEEIRDAVGQKSGIYLPRNIVLKCISILKKERIVTDINHQIKRIGTFDVDGFDECREKYRVTENTVIRSLISYVANYGKQWDESYAREQLIGVLDRTGLAYDIFFKTPAADVFLSGSELPIEDFNKMVPDDEELETEDDEEQPIFTDSLYVGKFVKETLSHDSVERDYLIRICEGLMICTGAFQIPSADADTPNNQRIKGTVFYFDTKLLLRFIGCAGDAAVQSAKELVNLIQSSGGSICYYPQTLEEMNYAFDNAIRRISNGYPPRDDEMRLYASSVGNNVLAVIAAKKAGLVAELSNNGIHKRELSIYSDAERIRFGFSKDDLVQYMQSQLRWDIKAIENDAASIFETHMQRKGKYNDYCGTNDRLPVFVTTNTRLIQVALKYREERPKVYAIGGWYSNRLPIITDMRLTCRLWSPAQEGERLSLLYLTANAIAAQRPTPRYINKIRELALEFEQQVPEYSEISLSEFFDDNVTNSVLQRTCGEEENLNLGTLASSIAELSEWKAKEEEKRTADAKYERDKIKEKYDSQQKDIIDGAVEKNKNKLGISRIWLRMILLWPLIATLVFAGISAFISYLCDNWHILWAIVVPIIVAGVECFSVSKFVKKIIAKALIPKAEKSLIQKVTNRLGKAELPYKNIIIAMIMEENLLFTKCKKYLNE